MNRWRETPSGEFASPLMIHEEFTLNRYKRIFTVVRQSGAFGPLDILRVSGMPKIGKGHPKYENLRVISITSTPRHPRLWDVVVKYGRIVEPTRLWKI